MIINPGDSNPVQSQPKVEAEKQKKEETIGDKTTKIANKALHSELSGSLQTKSDRLEASVSVDSSDDPVAEKTDQVGVELLSDDDLDFFEDEFGLDQEFSEFHDKKLNDQSLLNVEQEINTQADIYSKLEIEEKKVVEQEKVEIRLAAQKIQKAERIMVKVEVDVASVTRDIEGVKTLEVTIQKINLEIKKSTTEIQEKVHVIVQIIGDTIIYDDVDPENLEQYKSQYLGLIKDGNIITFDGEVLKKHGNPKYAISAKDLTPEQKANPHTLNHRHLPQHLVKNVQVMSQNDQNQALKLIQTHLFLKNQILALTNLLNEIKDQIKNSKPQQKPTEHLAETHVEHEKTPPKHNPQKHDIEKIIITNHLMSDVKGAYNKKRQRVHDDKKDEEFQRIKEAKIEKKLKSDRLTDENIKSDHLKRENKIKSEKKQK